MALPDPITIVLVLPGDIVVGAPNQGQRYNEDTAKQNTAITQIYNALRDYSAKSVIRTINDLTPDANGNYVIPKTVLLEALTTAQRDAITGAGLVIGRMIYNTTIRAIQVYGNNGWQTAGSEASTSYSFTRMGGVVTTVTENRPDGSKRLSVIRYANDRPTSVTRYNPSETETLTYDASGYLTGVAKTA